MTDDRRYRDVRRELEEQGYLSGPVQRFVFRELMVEHSRSARLVRTAWKAALLGGPMLGLWLALTAAISNWPLLRVSDVAWLWLYFTLISAIVLFLLVAAVAWAVGAWVRHRPGGARGADALRGALIVGIPTLIYLLLVWSRRSSHQDLWADAVFLIGANLAALLIAWLAGLVSMVSAVGRTGAVPDRNRRPIAILLLVLLPLTAAGLVARAAWGGLPERRTTEFEPVDQPQLFVIALDGWDAASLDRWEAAEHGFAHLRGSSVRFPLTRDARAEPAEVWTTIATGVPPSLHGVTGAGGERLPGVATPLRPSVGPVPIRAALEFLLPTRTVPISGQGRSVRALWEIVALKKPSLSIGWWASWPADQDQASRGRGFVVSDRLLPKLLTGGEFNRETEPAALFDRLRSEFPAIQADLKQEFNLAFGERGGSPGADVVWESFLIDGLRCRLLDRLALRSDLRATFVYFPGLDILRMRLSDLESLGEWQLRYEAWLSAELSSQIEDAVGRGARILIVADRGRSPELASGEVLVGPVFESCPSYGISIESVAPLALRLLGFPVSREMTGSQPWGACSAFPAPEPLSIESYGRRTVESDRGGGPDEQEVLDRLRSLGYLD